MTKFKCWYWFLCKCANLVDSKYKNWKGLYRKSSWLTQVQQHHPKSVFMIIVILDLNGASLTHSHCGIENNLHTLQMPALSQPRAHLKM